MKKLEILFHALVILGLLLLIVLILVVLSNEAWAMNLLKNQCIAECLELNKLNPNTCVC